MIEPKVNIYYQNVARTRRARGFSRKELEAAGLTVNDALWMRLPVDTKRKSEHEDNIAILLSIMQRLEIEPEAEAVEQRPVEVPEEDAGIEEVGVEDIPGIGPKTAENLRSAGYLCAGDLCKADVAKLSEVKGISKKSATEIIEKAKNL